MKRIVLRLDPGVCNIKSFKNEKETYIHLPVLALIAFVESRHIKYMLYLSPK